jgi:hypothetical protein
MGNCKLTKSLDNKACEYAIAGARAVYLANYFAPIEYIPPAGEEVYAPPVNAIAYQYNADGYISSIHLPTGEFFYEVTGENNTISFTDTLLAGGNGSKYRQHTVNAVLNQYDIDVLNEGDALSLGRFIAVVIDNADRITVLGRTGGLSAPAGGFDYNSGAAEADATGWTVILQGTSKEIGQLVLNPTVITPIYQEAVIL